MPRYTAATGNLSDVCSNLAGGQRPGLVADSISNRSENALRPSAVAPSGRSGGACMEFSDK